MEMYIAIAAGILSLVVAFALMTKVKGADEGNDQMKMCIRDSSKAIFGKGAVSAAIYLAGKPAGMYDMSDVIG